MTAPIPTCEVTPQQLKMWADTRAALIWHCPAFTHILYTMMNKAGSEHIALFCNAKGPDGNYLLPVAAVEPERPALA